MPAAREKVFSWLVKLASSFKRSLSPNKVFILVGRESISASDLFVCGEAQTMELSKLLSLLI